jgi:hypothetical protein
MSRVEDDTFCHYCGQEASPEVGLEWDHVPALNVAIPEYLSELRKTLIRSCGECNKLASDVPHLDYLERHFWLKGALLRRYKRLLLNFDGKFVSTDELDGMLSAVVTNGIRHYKETMFRIGFGIKDTSDIESPTLNLRNRAGVLLKTALEDFLYGLPTEEDDSELKLEETYEESELEETGNSKPLIKRFPNESRYLASLLTRIKKAGRSKVMNKEELEMLVGYHPGIIDEKTYTLWAESLKKDSQALVPKEISYTVFNYSKPIDKEALNQIASYAKWEASFSLSDTDIFALRAAYKEFRSLYVLKKTIDLEAFLHFIESIQITTLDDYYTAYTTLKLWDNNFTRYPNYTYKKNLLPSIAGNKAKLKAKEPKKHTTKASPQPVSKLRSPITAYKKNVDNRKTNTILPNYLKARINTGNDRLDMARIRNMFSMVIKCYKEFISVNELYKVFSFESESDYVYFFNKLTERQKSKITDLF